MYQNITCEKYQILGKNIFQAFGFSEKESVQITDVLLWADLFGIESHGISRILKYYNLLKKGVVDVKSIPEKIFETTISSVYDAKSAMGQIIAEKAMSEAIEKAKAHGIGLVEVRNSNHYGIAGYYALMAAKEELIGISMTNTVAIMVPTFSAEALLGSNPIAIAVPTEKNPFLYDGATTVITRGKLELYKKLGKELPYDWTVDENGEVSHDPNEVLECIDKKKGGGILPVGGIGEEQAGYKGYGYAMICEILTSVLAGGVSSIHKKDLGDTSHCFYAIDPGIFGDKKAIKERMTKFIQEIHAAKKATGQTHIYVPGEKEFNRANERKENGISINVKTINELNNIAKELGLEGI